MICLDEVLAAATSSKVAPPFITFKNIVELLRLYIELCQPLFNSLSCSVYFVISCAWLPLPVEPKYYSFKSIQ